jgi:hypothetical protein
MSCSGARDEGGRRISCSCSWSREGEKNIMEDGQ